MTSSWFARDGGRQLAERLAHQARLQPHVRVPMSPSSSAFGISAATESITTRSTASDWTSISVMSSACSPVSGCETSESLGLDPDLRA